MFIDIHRHSMDKGLADLVLQNVFHSDASHIKSTGYYSAGLHPWHVNESSLARDIKMVKEMSQYPNVIAIGEAGIDKVIKADIQLQKKAFEAQVDIAKEADKPLIIHCVRAYDEILHYRKEKNHSSPWIIHWFNASLETANELIRKNCFLSFGHMLFNYESKAYKTFCQVPAENIFFETDDAGITICEVYLQAAKLRNIDVEDLKAQINLNFKNCFGIEV